MKVKYEIWVKRSGSWYLPDARPFTHPTKEHLATVAEAIKAGNREAKINCYLDGEVCKELSILPKE